MMGRLVVPLILVLAVSGVLSYPGRCRPGDRWRDECDNACFCSERGTPVCTEMGCIKPNPPHKRDLSTGKCTPGTTWKDDCNTCGCDQNGNAYCTLMACLPKDAVPRPKRDAGKCTPGTTWKDDCNTCGCDQNGNAYCTLMACLPKDAVPRPKRDEDGKCVPGTSWKEDCNSCGCDDNGNAYCTDMACPDPSDMRKKRSLPGESTVGRCTPGSSWYDGCNRCRCNDNGAAICTKRACPPDNHQQHHVNKRDLPHGPGQESCVPGSTWAKDCNTCFCTNDGFTACTDMACPQSSNKKVKRSCYWRNYYVLTNCTPGEPWEDYRDDEAECTCFPDGRPHCLKYSCVSYFIIPEGCKPGIVMSVDNGEWNCTCDGNEIHSCLQTRTPPVNPKPIRQRRTTEYDKEFPPLRCTPGDSWKNGGLQCVCDDKGATICTITHGPPSWTQPPKPKQVRDRRSTEKCDPGETWMENCNRCFCTNDGTAACTKKRCLPHNT